MNGNKRIKRKNNKLGNNRNYDNNKLQWVERNGVRGFVGITFRHFLVNNAILIVFYYFQYLGNNISLNTKIN